MANGIVAFLSNNPVVIWGGIIMTAVLYLVIKHIEEMNKEDLQVPQPRKLEDIVKPKVEAQLKHRGVVPESKMDFKIGRITKGEVKRHLETKMPQKLLNPNPRASGDEDEGDTTMKDVRVIEIGPSSFTGRLIDQLLQVLAGEDAGKSKIYIYREDSLLDVPGPDIVANDEVITYNFAGMEVEVSNPSRNMVHRAVQTEVSENVLSAIPNYTEKVDFLFPLHSQKIKEIEQEGEHLTEDEF